MEGTMRGDDPLAITHTTRRLILTGALLMLISLPFVLHGLPVPLEISMFLIVILDVVAGITNPVHPWVSLFDVITCLLAVIFFESYAVATYLSDSFGNILLYLNEILAIVFFFALYYSVKGLWEGYLVRRIKG